VSNAEGRHLKEIKVPYQ